MVAFNTEPIIFDLCDATPNVAQLSVVNGTQLSAQLLFARDPLDGIRMITETTGRQQPLPQWVSGQGAIVGYEGGTAAVRALHAKLKAANVSVAGYWLQDWSGLRQDTFGTRLWWNWEVDDVQYAGWDALLEDLAEDGIRMLTYINPFLANNVARDKKTGYRRDLFAEAAKLGFLVKNASGHPYIQFSGSKSFQFGTIDLTNPGAVSFFTQIIQCNMLRVGVGCGPNGTTLLGPSKYSTYGWMSDFAEYIPFDSILHSGDPIKVHNKFPEMWAQTNRIAVNAAGFDGMSAFFRDRLHSVHLFIPSFSGWAISSLRLTLMTDFILRSLVCFPGAL